MSVEFRLKYIRDVIDKNINEVLLKWNARKVILNEPFDEDRKEMCPACIKKGQQRYLQYLYVNIDEAVYKCESAACLYPFRDFKYKNFTERTIFRYERIITTDEPTQKVFTSPTKVENDDEDFFNISWLDNSFTAETELDNMLTAPSEGIACDIKEIINNICSNVETTTSISPSKLRNEHSPTATGPRLSKCLKYIRQISPKQSFSNKVKPELKTATPSSEQISQEYNSEKAPSKFKLPEMLGTKSIVKNRKFSKKNREIPLLISPNVNQHPLAYLDWLDVVSKMEPEKMQEFEFTEVKKNYENNLSNSKNDVSNNTEKSLDTSTHLPILVEIMGTSATYHVNANQLSNEGEPCSSQHLGPNDLHTIQNATIQDQIISQTTENISSKEQISSTNTTSAESITNAINIGVEHSDSDFQIVKTGVVTCRNPTNATVRDQQKERAKINENKPKKRNLDQTKAELKIKKLPLKLEKKERKPEEKRKLQKEVIEQVNQNKEVIDIDVQENFYGFETLEPFQPIQLQTKEVVWLKAE